jgi:hypothetical protein
MHSLMHSASHDLDAASPAQGFWESNVNTIGNCESGQANSYLLLETRQSGDNPGMHKMVHLELMKHGSDNINYIYCFSEFEPSTVSSPVLIIGTKICKESVRLQNNFTQKIMFAGLLSFLIIGCCFHGSFAP